MSSSPRWARFFAREELRRRRYAAFVPAEPTTDLQHGDLECRFTFPVDDGRAPGYLDAPWRRANRQTPPADYEVLTTDLREDDVVSGGLAKADAALRSAAAEAGARRLVAFNPACVPDLTGEDTAGLARGAAGSARVLFRPSDGTDMTLKAVREAAHAARAGARRSAAPTVALLGFVGGRAQAELRSWLAALGVETVACLAPCLAEECFRAAATATALIAADDRIFGEAARAAAAALGRDAVVPPPPYGFGGARAWLESVARAAGAPPRAWDEVGPRLDALVRSADAARAAAEEHRLAFVVAPGEEALLDLPAENGGVPLAPLLRSLGFGVEVLAGPFASRAQLAERLARGRFDAVYSDFAFDRRPGRAGKARFSLTAFEPGPEGAARTLARLLGLCRLGFYRRYAEHLR